MRCVLLCEVVLFDVWYVCDDDVECCVCLGVVCDDDGEVFDVCGVGVWVCGVVLCECGG